jgi:radical SAM superfamily enzyme YgiQ (UPF0313 family)
MVILGDWQGRPLALSLKPGSLTVSVDGPERATVMSYDRAGRLWTAFVNDVSYRRGLDGRILSKWRKPGEDRERRHLPHDEARMLETRIWSLLFSLCEAIEGEAVVWQTPFPGEAWDALQAVLAFDAEASQVDAARYFEIYKPVGILPPDHYMAVVLQATEGCSFNTCTFCDFYKDRPFRIKSPMEFRAHAEAVRDYLGDGLSLRRTLFLGDANALVIPLPRLIPLLQIVNDIYDVEALSSIYGFMDGFSGHKKSASDYAKLAELGLAGVYIGLESGHNPLLEQLRKPGRAEDVVEAAHALKSVGVAVSVIVLLGAGGAEMAEAHVRDTARVLNAMPLDGDDIIYFSELIVHQELPYAQDAAGQGPLSHEERVAQGDAIEDLLTFRDPAYRPIVSRYDIREFVY